MAKALQEQCFVRKGGKIIHLAISCGSAYAFYVCFHVCVCLNTCMGALGCLHVEVLAHVRPGRIYQDLSFLFQSGCLLRRVSLQNNIQEKLSKLKQEKLNVKEEIRRLEPELQKVDTLLSFLLMLSFLQCFFLISMVWFVFTAEECHKKESRGHPEAREENQ